MRKEAKDGAEQLRVVKVRLLLELRQTTPQGEGQYHHQRAGDPVNGTPAAEACQQPGDGSRQQDTQQQSAHHGSDHFATLFRWGEGGRHRDQKLRDDGEESRKGGTEDHHDQRTAAGGDQHASRGEQRHGDNQRATFKHIAQRYEEQQPGGVAQLRGGNDKTGLSGA